MEVGEEVKLEIEPLIVDMSGGPRSNDTLKRYCSIAHIVTRLTRKQQSIPRACACLGYGKNKGISIFKKFNKAFP
jgi:hypothetical protein